MTGMKPGDLTAPRSDQIACSQDKQQQQISPTNGVFAIVSRFVRLRWSGLFVVFRMNEQLSCKERCWAVISAANCSPAIGDERRATTEPDSSRRERVLALEETIFSPTNPAGDAIANQIKSVFRLSRSVRLRWRPVDGGKTRLLERLRAGAERESEPQMKVLTASRRGKKFLLNLWVRQVKRSCLLGKCESKRTQLGDRVNLTWTHLSDVHVRYICVLLCNEVLTCVCRKKV